MKLYRWLIFGGVLGLIGLYSACGPEFSIEHEDNSNLERSEMSLNEGGNGPLMDDLSGPPVEFETAGGTNYLPVGNLEAVARDGTIAGWALDPNELDKPVKIVVEFSSCFIVDSVVATTTTTFRSDVQRKYGSARGLHGWALKGQSYNVHCTIGGVRPDFRVHAFAVDTQTGQKREIGSRWVSADYFQPSPAPAPSVPPSVIGYFDFSDPYGNVIGWALDRNSLSTSVRVTITVDDGVSASSPTLLSVTTTALQSRLDVQRVHKTPHTNYGFVTRIIPDDHPLRTGKTYRVRAWAHSADEKTKTFVGEHKTVFNPNKSLLQSPPDISSGGTGCADHSCIWLKGNFAASTPLWWIRVRPVRKTTWDSTTIPATQDGQTLSVRLSGAELTELRTYGLNVTATNAFGVESSRPIFVKSP